MSAYWDVSWNCSREQLGMFYNKLILSSYGDKSHPSAILFIALYICSELPFFSSSELHHNSIRDNDLGIKTKPIYPIRIVLIRTPCRL